MKKVLALVLLALSLASCSMVTASMEKWKGKAANELLWRWGPPTHEYSDGNGGRVLVYVRYRGLLQPATTTTRSYIDGAVYNGQIYGEVTTQTVYTPALMVSFDAYRTFWVNKDGIIYGYAWKGL